MWTSWGSTRSSARYFTRTRAISSDNIGRIMKNRAQPCQDVHGASGEWKIGHEQAYRPEGQLYPGLHQKTHGQQAKGGDSAPLFPSGEALPEVLCPALRYSSAQERHGPVWAVLEEGHKNYQSIGTTSYEEGLKELGLFTRTESSRVMSLWSFNTKRGLPWKMKTDF